jgi:transcriptional regulator of acetoin/glycerol metabolism
VGELESVLHHATLKAGGGEITLRHLPSGLRFVPPPLRDLGGGARDDREALVAALDDAGGNRTRAARALGVSRVTLWKRMKRLGLLALLGAIRHGAELLGG